jgi:competence protein ComFC
LRRVCRRRDFGFDGARAPLRYEGVGKELVHALKYKGYVRDVQKRGFQNQAELMAEGGSGEDRRAHFR